MGGKNISRCSVLSRSHSNGEIEMLRFHVTSKTVEKSVNRNNRPYHWNYVAAASDFNNFYRASECHPRRARYCFNRCPSVSPTHAGILYLYLNGRAYKTKWCPYQRQKVWRCVHSFRHSTNIGQADRPLIPF